MIGIIAENVSLTGMSQFLNDTFKSKQNGSKFTVSDCQQYVKIGFLPRYLGSFMIEINNNKYSKTYNILKFKNEI